MCDRAKVIHRQGSVDVMVSSEPLDSAGRTYGNIARSIKTRAQSVWGVRFEETPNSLTAICPHRSGFLMAGVRALRSLKKKVIFFEKSCRKIWIFNKS